MMENLGSGLEGRGKGCFLKLCGSLWGIGVVGKNVITMVGGEADVDITLVINRVVM